MLIVSAGSWGAKTGSSRITRSTPSFVAVTYVCLSVHCSSGGIRSSSSVIIVFTIDSNALLASPSFLLDTARTRRNILMITSLLSFTVSGIFLLLHQGLANASIFIVFTNVHICPENNILYTFHAVDMQQYENNRYIHGLRKHTSELVAGATPSV